MEWMRTAGPLNSDDGDSGWERAAALVRAGNRIGATYMLCAQTGQSFHAAESAVATLARVLERPGTLPAESNPVRPSSEGHPGSGAAEPARPRS